MNRWQKQAVNYRLKSEKQVMNDLKKVYGDALKNVRAKISELMQYPNMQSKIYQLKYQRILESQIEAILDKLNTNQYETIEQYLKDCYEDGFIGTLYSMQGQGVPILFPIDQKQVLQSIYLDSKISKNLYTKLGIDIKNLKKTIRDEISRGVASGIGYAEISKSIGRKMGIGAANAVRIARTEGGRIQSESAFDAMKKAKAAGADVVKQWDSTLDGKTRPHHRELDGQIREIDEPFEVAGRKAMAPHHFGVASEDINCRCCLLERARWALGDDFDKMDNESKTIIHDIKADTYEDFKKQYYEVLDGNQGKS